MYTVWGLSYKDLLEGDIVLALVRGSGIFGAFLDI